MKKFSLFLIIVLVLSAAGCAEQTTDELPQEAPSNETVETIEIPAETEEPANITADEVLKVPELKIVSVTPEDYGINIKVKNVGNASAQDVYCGLVLFGASNSIAYSEYVTIDRLREAVLPTVHGGVTGTTYDYDTGYAYKDTPNLTISSRMIGIDFMGNIEPGQTGSSSIDIVDFGTSRSEYLKVAWLAGDEENMTMY